MEVPILGAKNKNLELAPEIFNCEFNEALVHQVVTAFLAAGRAGTQAQKTRANVRGGGAKPFRQKGTGRARAGTIRSPLWRKGGVIFAAQPRSYEQKVNKKMYRGALRAIFSELIRLERLIIVDSLELSSHKTKDLLSKLNDYQLTGRLVIVVEAVDENLYLAARNLPMVDVRDVAALDPACLVGAEKVLTTAAALKQIEEWLK